VDGIDLALLFCYFKNNDKAMEFADNPLRERVEIRRL
jgi:hypothetical protein